MSQNERRLSPRKTVVLPALFLSSGSSQNLTKAMTININATGLCLSCAETLTVGQELAIMVALPLGEKLTIQVKVIWIREVETAGVNDGEFRVGVKIMEPEKPDEKKFIQFYKEHLQTSTLYDEIETKTKAGPAWATHKHPTP